MLYFSFSFSLLSRSPSLGSRSRSTSYPPSAVSTTAMHNIFGPRIIRFENVSRRFISSEAYFNIFSSFSFSAPIRSRSILLSYDASHGAEICPEDGTIRLIKKIRRGNNSWSGGTNGRLRGGKSEMGKCEIDQNVSLSIRSRWTLTFCRLWVWFGPSADSLSFYLSLALSPALFETEYTLNFLARSPKSWRYSAR